MEPCLRLSKFLYLDRENKPVLVLHLIDGVTIIHLGATLLQRSSDLPGSESERAAPPPLFGLAPHGVCHRQWNYYHCGALLPHHFTLTRGRFSPTKGGILSVALSVEATLTQLPPAVSRHAALWRPDFPPANTHRRAISYSQSRD